MIVKNILKPLELATTNSAAFDGTYKVLTTGLAHQCNILRITNGCKLPITVSFDGGITDHEWIWPETSLQLNAQTNSMPTNQVALIAKGTAISVKGAASVGLIYLSGYYQPASAL